MTWEAVSAVGSVATAVIILITLIVGQRQLDQLRRATQLEGARGVLAELDSPAIDEARRFVLDELAVNLQDEQFRKEVELFAMSDVRVHKEMLLSRFFERVGAYVEEGLMDGEIVNKSGVARIMSAWLQLADVVAIHRRIWGDFAWKRFERLYDNAVIYVRAQGGDPDKMAAMMLGTAKNTRSRSDRSTKSQPHL